LLIFSESNFGQYVPCLQDSVNKFVIKIALQVNHRTSGCYCENSDFPEFQDKRSNIFCNNCKDKGGN